METVKDSDSTCQAKRDSFLSQVILKHFSQRKNWKMTFRAYYKIFCMTYGLVVFYYLFTFEGHAIENVKYLTNWGAIVFAAYFSLASYYSFYYHDDSSIIHLIAPNLRILYHILISIQLLICLFYWAFLYKHEFLWISQQGDLSSYWLYSSMTKHLVLPILSWLPLFIDRTQLKKQDVKEVFKFGVFYMFLNLFYTYLDKPVYVVMTWRDKHTIAYAGIALVIKIFGFYLGLKLSSFNSSEEHHEDIVEVVKREE